MMSVTQSKQNVMPFESVSEFTYHEKNKIIY